MDQPRQAGIAEQSLTEPGDFAVVLRVLLLLFNEGLHGRRGARRLTAEVFRLIRLLQAAHSDPEVGGLRLRPPFGDTDRTE